jgi:hypothetical protein
MMSERSAGCAKANTVAPVLCGAGAPTGSRARPISGTQNLIHPPLSRGPSFVPRQKPRGTARRSARHSLYARALIVHVAPSGAPSRLSLRPEGAQLSSRPRLLGRGLGGCYPPSACPSPASSSRSGHGIMPPERNPGAARERKERTLPPAGAASDLTCMTPHEAPSVDRTMWNTVLDGGGIMTPGIVSYRRFFRHDLGRGSIASGNTGMLRRSGESAHVR